MRNVVRQYDFKSFRTLTFHRILYGNDYGVKIVIRKKSHFGNALVLGSWCDDPCAAHTKLNWDWVQVKYQSQFVHKLRTSFTYVG